MQALRWTLCCITALFGGGFLTLVMFANGFRKSFGASANGLLVTVLPVVALACMFAALLWPGNRPLLHIGAAAAAGLLGVCVWQMITESATILWLVIIYLAAWFVFYNWAGWQGGAAS